ncbi:CD81 antigen [Ascaphus truei]|uniref:CD81 antigen n=1 Tax=Ascaphus truei TaxID=8439 RepID=UPI003F594F25
MMFVGFLGCYGAIQESQCLLGTFFTCLVILFACEVAVGIWGFVNRDQVSKEVKQFYDEAHQQALTGNKEQQEKAKSVLKVFHETLQCCGTNQLDGIITTFMARDLCPARENLLETLQTEDCHKKIETLFSTKLYLVGIAAIVVAVIMIIEMIFSMVLCCGIRIHSVY